MNSHVFNFDVILCKQAGFRGPKSLWGQLAIGNEFVSMVVRRPRQILIWVWIQQFHLGVHYKFLKGLYCTIFFQKLLEDATILEESTFLWF